MTNDVSAIREMLKPRKKEIKQIVQEQNATSMKDMGKVMKVAKEKIGTRADGKEINEIVKSLLQ